MIFFIYTYVIVIIILLLFSCYYYSNYCTCNDLLYGFWEADPSFCKDAGLDMFCFYINKNNKKGYLLGKHSDNIFINQPIDINISWNYGLYGVHKNTCMNGTILFKNLEPHLYDNFPPKQKIKFFPLMGKIVLYTDKTVYMILYQNKCLSELSNII